MTTMSDTVEVVIGGETLDVPPMTFYALRRAWPHVLRLAQMEATARASIGATLRLEQARIADPPTDPADLAVLEAAQAVALAEAEAKGADFVAQTDEKLHALAAALSLTEHPLSYDDLSKRLRPDEFAGVHTAFNRLLAISGLSAPGEAPATGSTPLRTSNGTDTPPSLSPTA